jgi:hypothetical protein
MEIEQIWQLEDEIRAVVDANLGGHVWSLNYEEACGEIRLALDIHLDDDAIENLCAQFFIGASYIGEGEMGSEFALYPDS